MSGGFLLPGLDIAGATSATYDTPPLAIGSYAYAVRVAGATGPGGPQTSAAVPVTVSSAAGPGVLANSLGAVRRSGVAALSWSSAGSGTGNLHRTALRSELDPMWTRAVLVTTRSPAGADAGPPPGP